MFLKLFIRALFFINFEFIQLIYVYFSKHIFKTFKLKINRFGSNKAVLTALLSLGMGIDIN